MLSRFFFFFLIGLFPDVYIFFRHVWKKCQWRTQVLYTVFSLLCFVLLVLMFGVYSSSESVATLYETSMVMNALIAVFVAKLFFSIVDVWTLAFKSRILRRVAIGVAAFGFFTYAYGIMLGRFNMSAKYITVENKSLPQNFDGYKILHISDFHLGSLYGDEEIVSKWVDMMNAENPDVICFTGDMVSILADEMASHMDALKRLKAKDGKFAIIGNHDYGDYHKWSSMEARDANLAKTEENIRQAGFDLLLNENRTICRNGDTISVVGIENWGRPPFPQNSDLKKAETGIASSTRILLSHDPDFWEYKLEDNTDYFLTLSGHTHAMQLGIEIGDWEISPSSLKYPYWHGLYERNGIQIVVSRGIGCTAIPFRIGMSPEYVVITLKK